MKSNKDSDYLYCVNEEFKDFQNQLNKILYTTGIDQLERTKI